MFAVRLSIFTLAICISSILYANTNQNGDLILGRWLSDNERSIVEFFKQDGKYFARTVWLAEPYDENGELKKDLKNPEESLRDRVLLGLVCIKDFIFSGNQTYEGGTGYAPKFGKTLNGSIKLLDEKTLELTVKVAFFTKKLIWTRDSSVGSNQ